MKKSLKRVRRLQEEIKNMEVTADLKQNHSILLYSLRMLEARLNTECPPTNNVEVMVEQGTLEEFLGSAGQLVDVDRAFEDQLAKDGDALAVCNSKRNIYIYKYICTRLSLIGSECHGVHPLCQGPW